MLIDKINSTLLKYKKDFESKFDLIVSIEKSIIEQKISLSFSINYANRKYSLFNLSLIDLDGNISLEYNYYKNSEYLIVKYDSLKKLLDKFIESEKTGNLIEYLLDINNKFKINNGL